MFPAEFTPHTFVREPTAIRVNPPLICFQSAMPPTPFAREALPSHAVRAERFTM
jgi:hypothetical protein